MMARGGPALRALTGATLSTSASALPQIVLAGKLHTMQPSQGRIVIASGGAAVSNGSETAPAMITRIWSADSGQGYHVINAIVFPDAGLPVTVTSARLYHDEAAAQAAMGDPTWYAGMTALYWPSRV